jgi:hypothetical protein
MLPTKFWSIWLSEAVSEEMIFLEINQIAHLVPIC